MSRRSSRTRARLTVTAAVTAGPDGSAPPEGAPATIIGRTRDLSGSGLFVETAVVLAAGTQLDLMVMDDARGEVITVAGLVARVLPATPGGQPAGLGIRLMAPDDEWRALVARLSRGRAQTTPGLGRRLRVMVVGDEARRRGALALYVTSGWDVRFASDVAGALEAMNGFRVDAVIAEHDLEDERWREVLEAARRVHPAARRIVRAKLGSRATPPAGGPDDLVHRVVDLDAGLEAVLDALTAEWGTP